jgi:hypothetical protein
MKFYRQVAKINNDTVMTGVPMMRPMFVEFPADAECYEPAAEAQYLLLIPPPQLFCVSLYVHQDS